MEKLIKLSEKEMSSLITLLDIAVRAQGIKVSPEALVIVKRLQDATDVKEEKKESKDVIKVSEKVEKNGK